MSVTVTELFTGTEAVGATEHSLTTDTAGPDAQASDACLQGFVDVSAMVAGDQLQLRIYEKVRSGDTQLAVHTAILTGAQSDPVWIPPALLLKHGWEVTAKMLTAAASTITIKWSLRTT